MVMIYQGNILVHNIVICTSWFDISRAIHFWTPCLPPVWSWCICK